MGPWAGDPTVSGAAALGQGRLWSCSLLPQEGLAGWSIPGLWPTQPLACPLLLLLAGVAGWPWGDPRGRWAGCSAVPDMGRAPVLAVPLVSAPASAGFGDLRGLARGSIRCAAPPPPARAGPGVHSHTGGSFTGRWQHPSQDPCSVAGCPPWSPTSCQGLSPRTVGWDLPQGSPLAPSELPLTMRGPEKPCWGLDGASTSARGRACGHMWGWPSQGHRCVGSGRAVPAPGWQLGGGSASGWGGSPGGLPRVGLCRGSRGRHLPAPAGGSRPH